MSDTPQWVLDKIEAVKAEGSTKLDLSGEWGNRGDLETIPPEVFELTFLTSLKINHHKIQSIPEEIAQLTNLTGLYLWANQITEIPEAITQLANLTELYLWANQITEIPEAIAQLANLTELYLWANQITEIPEAIAQLSKLTTLNLGSNQISEIPEAIAQLTNLKELSLFNNQIKEIPEAIAQLKNLTTLHLGRNQIKETPKVIAQLTNLSTLSLNSNQISEIPEAIAQLTNLTRLYLEVNQITEIPEVIAQLTNLTELYLSSNQIREISEAIAQLPKLENFEVSDNPIELPPPEVVEQGLEGIRNYYKQIREKGIAKLYEAKLLIVGEAGAGKTTLANKILDQHYELQPEDTTHGIDIHEYNFPYQDNDFRVNIWDFGGQEIYHATHRFFLTERSLYILVADERKEDTDFDYWLNIIQLLGKESPVIVLLNEKLGRKRKINESALRGQFSNLKEIISLDLSKSEEIPKLVNKIQAYLQTLDHIGDRLPRTWTNLRTFLETEGRNYITLQEYLDLCDDFGFKENTDKLSLSQYLHDLGIILHFQDDALLNKTVILNPEWATDAVYQILDHPEIIENYGTFSRKDLQLIAINTAFENMQDEVLQLMIKFKLCYRITETANIYISPQLLNPQQPSYRWKNDKNLVAEYDYDFMPKGIISQFIVELNRLIKDQNLVWRSGVILTKDNTDAEVIESLPQRKITIRVRGDHKRSLLTIIFHELDKIHDSFHGLKVDKLIPCNCPKCEPKPSPYLFPLGDVKRAIAAKRKTIECRYSFEGVDVKGLIEGVYDRASNLPSPVRDAEFLRDEHIMIENSTVTINRDTVTEPKPESLIKKDATPKLPSVLTSSFAMGYLFALVAVVILVAASVLHPVSLAIALIGITMLYVLIGVFTLRASDQTKDESMVQLVTIVLQQLPVLGNVVSAIRGMVNKGN